MSDRHYKHRRTGSLKREIEHIVNKEIAKDLELKRWGTFADSGTNCVNTGYIYDLSQIPQTASGNTFKSRDGDEIQAKTLRIRLDIQGQAPNGVTTTWADGAGICRYLIFSWVPYAPSSTITSAGIGQVLDTTTSPPPGFEVLAPHVPQGMSVQFKIHVDETVGIEVAPGNYFIYQDGGGTFHLKQVFLLRRYRK